MKKERELKESLENLKVSHPEKAVIFSAYVKSERSKAERITRNLSPQRKQEVLSGWESDEKTLELFDRWLASA